MPRIRISTTVDDALLGEARRLNSGAPDSVLVDKALKSLIADHRSAEIDASYDAYDRIPIETSDEWGDLGLLSQGCRLELMLPEHGDVWWCELPDTGSRPVVVLSRNAAIPRLRRTVIAPCTTTIRGLPSEVLLEPGEDPVPLPSAVNLDSIESVSLGSLISRMGRLSDIRMRQVCSALAVAMDC